MSEEQKLLKVKSIDDGKVVVVANGQEIELKKDFLPAKVKVGDKFLIVSKNDLSHQKSAKELLNEILGIE